MSKDKKPQPPHVGDFSAVFGGEINDAAREVRDVTGSNLSFHLLVYDAAGNIAISSNADPDALRQHIENCLEKLNSLAYRNSAKLAIMEPLTNSIH